jgi:hypothetical protein
MIWPRDLLAIVFDFLPEIRTKSIQFPYYKSIHWDYLVENYAKYHFAILQVTGNKFLLCNVFGDIRQELTTRRYYDGTMSRILCQIQQASNSATSYLSVTIDIQYTYERLNFFSLPLILANSNSLPAPESTSHAPRSFDEKTGRMDHPIPMSSLEFIEKNFADLL